MFAAACACGAITAIAQTSAAAGSSAASLSPAQQWQSLQNLGRPKPVAWPARTDATATMQARTQAIAAYVKDADQLLQFYTSYPTDPNAAEARRREALSLLYASRLGDTADAARTAALVTTVRRDSTLPAAEREEVAALSDNFGVAQQTGLARADRLLAFENVARGLQAEFPTVPAGSESLVQIAEASADDHAAVVAQEIINGSASDAVKTQAQILLRRLALKGRSVSDIANSALGPGNAVSEAAGHPLVIYTWASTAPASLATAKQVAALAPAGSNLIGVCVDFGDLTRAKALGANLPGAQLYDPLGFMGRLTGRLELSRPGLVYLADAKGVLLSVSAQNDLKSALAAVSVQ